MRDGREQGARLTALLPSVGLSVRRLSGAWDELAINEPAVRIFERGLADYELVTTCGIRLERHFNKRTASRIIKVRPTPHIMKIQGPPIRVVWSLFWRAVVLTPFATLYFWLICIAYGAVFLLPIAVGHYLWLAEWWLAAGCAVGWVPSFIFVRWAARRDGSDTKSDRGVLI